MSEAMLVRRGGASLAPGGALLRIRAEAGATVTATDGAVTRTLGADKGRLCADDARFADYYVRVAPAQYGSWTITSTLSGVTWSDTVSVSAAVQYDIPAYRLPAAYQELSYIESTGTQYILTPVRSNQVKKGTMQVLVNAKSASMHLIGAYDSGTAAGGFSFTSEINLFYMNNNFGSISAPISTPFTLSWAFRVGYQEYMMNSTEVTKSIGSVPTTSKYVALFCTNTGSAVSFAKARIMSCVLRDENDTLLGNYIPCKRRSDGVPGLWDTVTKTFLTNQGTGDFGAGLPV